MSPFSLADHTTGWFQNWGEPVPHRPAVDVAFDVARWVAKGGSYMTYYMAFGGTSFARSVGGPLIVTSYDYDVQVGTCSYSWSETNDSIRRTCWRCELDIF